MRTSHQPTHQRKILCVYPRYARSFGTFQHAYEFFGGRVRAFMPPQGLLVVAAHSADPYAEGASSHVAPILSSSVARSTVRSEAAVAAHGSNPYAEGYGQGVTLVSRGFVNRAAVRAKARDVAHGVDQLPL